MTVLTEQERNWVGEVAGRLRLIQADAATTTPEKRGEYLQEEVARNLKTMPPAQRKRYLEGLLARFPVAGQVLKPAPATPAPEPKPVAESPDQLLARLLAAAAGLPPERRAELSKRLAEAGLAPAPPAAPVVEIGDEVRKALGLAAGQQPRLDRLAQMGVIVVEMVHSLNERAVDAMRDLLPRNQKFDRPSDFRQAAARFLTGENESLDAPVRAVTRLVGRLLVALQGGGKHFGRKYVDRYSPSAILEVVESEKQFGWLPGQPSKKECCWSKYDDLAREISTPDLVDRQIKDSLAEYMGRIGQGGQPPA